MLIPFILPIRPRGICTAILLLKLLLLLHTLFFTIELALSILKQGFYINRLLFFIFPHKSINP